MRLTGTRIGSVAYGSVEEVAIPVGAAAKKIHDIFQDRSEIPEDEILRASSQFVRECQLMSTRTSSSSWACASFPARDCPH